MSRAKKTSDIELMALPAAHVERPHAVGAHVAEGHWRPGLRVCPETSGWIAEFSEHEAD
jgi:hypothetical protein